MALYMNGQEISQSSGVPIAVEGLTAVNEGTPSNISGLVKGNGSTLQAAQAGMDYATPEDAKTFLVTFTGVGSGITADKTIDEIYTQYNLNRNIIGLYRGCLFSLVMCKPELAVFQGLFNSTLGVIQYSSVFGTNFGEAELVLKPSQRDTLPASGTALTANTIYAVTDAVGTYAFTPPDTGWAHGYFATGASVSVSFSGTFMGAAPTIEASKAYEFDVFDGVWAVQEVVSA